MNRKICIIVNGYPTKDDPVYAFIQPIVWEMADNGIECTVIAPQSISKAVVTNKVKRPYRWVDQTDKGNKVIIYQPEYISVSNLSIFGYRISTILRDISINRCFYKEKIAPDLIYAHFWDCAIVACKLATTSNLSVFVATGESKIRVKNYYNHKYIDKYLSRIKGVIAVSTKNLEESHSLGLLKFNPKTIVLPNAVNPNEFYPIPKKKARKILGINADAKLVIFVGSFCNRKGVLRVVEAVEKIENVQLILIGSGEQIPKSNRILFSGKVPHNEIVLYLNAADIFVLPTLAEGCCNALVEALACGVPIISSDLPFNYDILNSSNSIMINPERIDLISQAISTLFANDEKLKSLSVGARNTGIKLSIQHRCDEILRMME